MTAPVAVLGWGAYMTGYAGIAGYCSGRPDPDFDQPKAAIVPARQRRRASLLSKAMADAYAEALSTAAGAGSGGDARDADAEDAAAGIDAGRVASVFGSALGEAATMIELLDQMWDAQAMLSPMRFATSVHNAASGMISIATENRGFTTSIGADFDTPAMALLEGIGWVLAHHEPVVVCCGDEAPPPDLVPGDAGWALVTAAIAIGPVAGSPAGRPTLSGLAMPDPAAHHGAPQLEPHEVSRPIRQNPVVGLLDLVVACERGQRGRLRLDRGPGRGFEIEIGDATDPAAEKTAVGAAD